MTELPRGKWQRCRIGGQAAAQVGGEMLKYYAKRPFLSDKDRHRAREKMEEESAAAVFQSLALLKGTAVKIAQMLSLETDFFPQPLSRELAKSYNQIPPMNRALVRKTISTSLEAPPEKIFRQFNTKAFAAASLGQVHAAQTMDGSRVAVKIQYPGIGKTIGSDMQLVRQMLRPLPEYRTLLPVLKEIEERLKEEVDYRKEAENAAWFSEHLHGKNCRIPEVKKALSTDNVLTLSLLKGLPLNEWLRTNPGQQARDHVAQQLNDWFLYCFYSLHCIHADPNPGNFIIDPGLNLGLVDFGCIRRFETDFIEKYRLLVRALLDQNQSAHHQLFQELGFIKGELRDEGAETLKKIFIRFGDWFRQMYADPCFDFGANPKFMESARSVTQGIYKLRRNLSMNPNFVYLDRTRYGLLKIFQQMGARVRIRNAHE